MNKVTIIVLNYNGRKFLKKCFDSIRNLDYPAGFDVIMADDNSKDDSADYVRKEYPWVKVIRNEKNLGACASFNKAAAQADTDLLVKVDNDIIVDKNWLKEMVQTLESDHQIGAVGSLLLHYSPAKDVPFVMEESSALDRYKSTQVQDIGSNIDRFGYMMNYYILDGLPVDGTKILDVFYISGCSMLFRKSLFEHAGRFDEKFFIYKDDLDLCWRMRVLGYKIVTNLDSKMYHLSGQLEGGTSVLDGQGKYHTTARKRFLGERNTLRTLLKNYSVGSLLKVLPLYLGIILAEILFFAITGQIDVSLAYLRALWWNVVNLPDTWRLRQHLQSKRRVPDTVVMRNTLPGSAKLEYLRQIKVPSFD